jgi:membrane protease YdiL (CAAX protease family)
MNARVPAYAAVMLLAAYALAWVYSLFPDPRWVWVALVHTPLAAVLWWKGPKADPATVRDAGIRKLALFAAFIYLGVLGMMGLLSRLFVPGAPPLEWPAPDGLLLLTGVWIPVIEECIFRGAVGRWLQTKLGAYWGIYLSAIFFAALHSSPPQSWMPPIGPFLLALCCELIVRISGRLAPAILLHACCNASPLVFALLDARWLGWLSELYLDLN